MIDAVQKQYLSKKKPFRDDLPKSTARLYVDAEKYQLFRLN